MKQINLYYKNKAYFMPATEKKFFLFILLTSLISSFPTQILGKGRLHRCIDYSRAELEHKATPYNVAIKAAATHYNLDPNLIKAVITVESCFRPLAASHKNAQGLMQLIPATARRFGVKNITNPTQNIDGGAQYLRWLMRRYNGNLDWVLSAYNAGEGRVDRAKGIPKIRGVKAYVKNVSYVYKKLSVKKEQHFIPVINIASSSTMPRKIIHYKPRLPIYSAPPIRSKPLIHSTPLIPKSILKPMICASEKRYGKYINYEGYRPGAVVGNYYIVKQGDTVKNLSQEMQININTFMKINGGIHISHKFQQGERVRIRACRS